MAERLHQLMASADSGHLRDLVLVPDQEASTLIFQAMEFNSNKAIYLQISDMICEQILSGALAADDRIPSVREYGASIGVNPNTVMRTYEKLTNEGISTTNAASATSSARKPRTLCWRTTAKSSWRSSCRPSSRRWNCSDSTRRSCLTKTIG